MRNISFYLLLIIGFFCSCHEDEEGITDIGEQPLVEYRIVVVDSASGAPLGGVEIELTKINKKTSTYFTDSITGKVNLNEFESSRNLFSFFKDGYISLDTIDVITEKNDSVFNIPILKVLRIELVSVESRNQIAADSNQNIQYRILLRDALLNTLTSGSIKYTDSTGVERLAIDEDGDGKIILTNLGLGSHIILVEHAGYLGQNMPVEIKKGVNDSTTSKWIESFPVTLIPLQNQVSGQVFTKASGSGEVPLEGARVVFVLGDTLSVPHSFETLTDVEGNYVLDSLPRLGGTLEYYLDVDAQEPSVIEEITKLEISLARKLDPVIIDPSLGVSGSPIVITVPSDTVLPEDKLVFVFNQDFDLAETSVNIQMANQGLPLYTPLIQTNSKTLSVSLDGAEWEEDKLYQYSLLSKNLLGDPFNSASGKEGHITGFFFVYDPQSEVGEEVLLPYGYRLPYFNSGTDRVIDSASQSSSLYADSSSNMTVLKWLWPANDGEMTRADSLSVYIKDSRNYTQWTSWITFPAALDSFVLFFNDMYSTSGSLPSSKPTFPLRIPGENSFELRVVPKHKNRIYYDSSFTFSPILQEMGPSLYVLYQPKDSLLYASDSSGDSIYVSFSFLQNPVDDSAFAKFDISGYSPEIFFSDKNADITISWEWISKHSGWIKYAFNSFEDLRYEYFQIQNLDGASVYNQPRTTLHTKRIWLRNRDEKVTLE